MGSLSQLHGERVYLDANVFIYALEGHRELATALRELFQKVDQGRISAFTSELSLAEILVKPLELGDEVREAAYSKAISSRPGLSVVAVSRSVLVEAARLRAADKLRLPDAIHVATAVGSECSVFLTNDRRLRSRPGLELVAVSELG